MIHFLNKNITLNRPKHKGGRYAEFRGFMVLNCTVGMVLNCQISQRYSSPDAICTR